MGRNNLICAILAGAGAILALPAAADTKAGVDSWTRGDYTAAVKEWQADAARGDVDAIFNLGQAYKLGKGVKQDLARAEQLFGQAAAMGHLQASDNYGLLVFQRGDHAKALPYIRTAADRGDPRAQYLLGLAHFNGDQVPKDWVRAYALVSLAQQQGLPQAVSALTEMDKYVPMDQRQQAVQLAGELQSQADATRARQLAAIDLGNQVPGGNPAAAPVPPATLRGPAMASADDPLSRAQRTAGSDSPATAGADYARPAAPRPALPPAPRPVVHSGPPPQTATPAPPPPAPAPGPAAASGKWRIQFGAFGVAANADSLWSRLKARPELAGHPRLNVKAGAVTKLQAGGFASQAAAQAACARLQAAGFTCVAISG